MEPKEPKGRIIVALDVDNPEKAITIVEQLRDHVGLFKVGLQLIYAIFAGLVSIPTEDVAVSNLRISRRLFGLLKGKLFLDGKFHDIPNTMAGVSAEVAKIEPVMFNLHVSADIEAMMAAVAKKGNSKVLGVTVLTSLSGEICQLIYGDTPGAKVLQFARDAKLAGIDGLICSPQEITLLRGQKELKGMLLATPGVRPAWAAKGDQARTETPGGAIEAGADYLVIGRPITNPPPEIGTPVDAAKKIAEEIATALAGRK
jgi:orotidine-5'-phosphate decarboxylase